MLPVEFFFKELYDYFRAFTGNESAITTSVRLKSWNIYKLRDRCNMVMFWLTIKSLAFELLTTPTTGIYTELYHDCFTVIDDEYIDYLSTTTDIDYATYEELCLKIRDIYTNSNREIMNSLIR